VRYSKRRSRANLYEWIEGALREFDFFALGRVVNIGAGGDVAVLLKRIGLAPLSIDVDPARNPDLVGDIQDLSILEDCSVDGVVCIEVLEHVKHPHLALQELHRIMKPGGIFVGSTPFLLGIHDQPHDYFRYTRHGLELLFDKFEQVYLRERNGYFAATAVLLHRRFVVGSPRERAALLLLSPILITMVSFLSLVDRAIPATDGTTGYFFVYRKPGGA
jgi:SAM-dependent methyltransferase